MAWKENFAQLKSQAESVWVDLPLEVNQALMHWLTAEYDVCIGFEKESAIRIRNAIANAGDDAKKHWSIERVRNQCYDEMAERAIQIQQETEVEIIKKVNATASIVNAQHLTGEHAKASFMLEPLGLPWWIETGLFNRRNRIGFIYLHSKNSDSMLSLWKELGQAKSNVALAWIASGLFAKCELETAFEVATQNCQEKVEVLAKVQSQIDQAMEAGKLKHQFGAKAWQKSKKTL